MKPQFTPGPWNIDSESFATDSDSNAIYSDGYTIALVHRSNYANAALIAAAPEMFEALEAITDCYENAIRSEYEGTSQLDGRLEIVTKARAALAKAGGESC